MSALQERLQRLAVYKLIGDHLKERDGAEKAGLVEFAGKRMGATGVEHPGDSGLEIATVSIVPEGPTGWEVTDRVAWVEHVRKVRPQAIIETVRESDEKDLLKSIDVSDVPPGVTPKDGRPGYVLVRQSAEQKRNALDAYAEGLLEIPGMVPEIEADDADT